MKGFSQFVAKTANQFVRKLTTEAAKKAFDDKNDIHSDTASSERLNRLAQSGGGSFSDGSQGKIPEVTQRLMRQASDDISKMRFPKRSETRMLRAHSMPDIHESLSYSLRQIASANNLARQSKQSTQSSSGIDLASFIDKTNR